MFGHPRYNKNKLGSIQQMQIIQVGFDTSNKDVKILLMLVIFLEYIFFVYLLKGYFSGRGFVYHLLKGTPNV